MTLILAALALLLMLIVALLALTPAAMREQVEAEDDR